MKINTKVVFEWNPKSKQYEEVYCDSYEYNGEVAECQLFGKKKLGIQPGGGYNFAFGAGPSGTPAATQFHQPYNPNPGWSNQDYMQQLLNIGGPMFNAPQAMGGTKWAKGGAFTKRFRLSPVPALGAQDGIGAYGVPTFNASMTMGGQDSNVPMMTMAGHAGTLGEGSDVSTAPFPRSTDVGTGTAAAPSWFEQNKGVTTAAGGLLGAFTGFMQAKSQKKGLGVAIGELDPLKDKFMEEHERQLGLAEAYRPGGKYSQYMAGQMYSQAAESAGQESQRMIASGITSPSMMRAMARQSRRRTQAAMPGMELQLSQMALPYEQLGAKSLTQYGGVVEQLASLKGARSSINPFSSAISGGMQGMMGAASMIGSLASDRRIKKDIKYLHTSNDGHKVYSFKYKGGDTKYSGVMAQDVLKINPNAVVLKNGILAVYYDMIDVNMQQLDIIQ